MKYFTFIFSVFFIFVSFQLKAQQTYSKVYYNGGSVSNGLYHSSVIGAEDNGCLIAGKIDSTGILIKVDSLGNVLWSKTLSVPMEIMDLVKSRDTCYYVLGKKFNSMNDYVGLMKIDLHGGIIWSRKVQYASSLFLQPLSIRSTIDSGLIFCGNTATSSQKTFITKIDKNGNINWSTMLQVDNSSTVFHSIAQVPDSGFVMTGSIGQTKASILKLNKNGNVVWCKSYIGTDSIYRNGMDILVHNNKLYSYFSSSTHPLFMITDLSGNFVSSKEYALSSNYNYNPSTYVSSFRLQKSIGAGFYMTICYGYTNVLLNKIDSIGNSEWYSDADLALGIAAVQSQDKGFVLIGNGPLGGFRMAYGEPQIGLIKTDSLGVGLCLNKSNTSLTSLTLNASGTTYTQTALGSSQVFNIGLSTMSISSKNDCVDIISGIHDLSTTNQISIFPNPSSGNISVTIANQLNSPLKYRIINLTGQTVFEKIVSTNESTVTLDCQSLPPSMYILQVTSKGEVIGTKQIIITP